MYRSTSTICAVALRVLAAASPACLRGISLVAGEAFAAHSTCIGLLCLSLSAFGNPYLPGAPPLYLLEAFAFVYRHSVGLPGGMQSLVCHIYLLGMSHWSDVFFPLVFRYFWQLCVQHSKIVGGAGTLCKNSTSRWGVFLLFGRPLKRGVLASQLREMLLHKQQLWCTCDYSLRHVRRDI